jgi:hypothetical protein
MESTPSRALLFSLFLSLSLSLTSDRRLAACAAASRTATEPQIAFSIFQVDRDKLKMSRSRSRFVRAVRAYTARMRARARVLRAAQLCNSRCIRLLGARSAVLIPPHARILWSLQFQRGTSSSGSRSLLPFSLASSSVDWNKNSGDL